MARVSRLTRGVSPVLFVLVGLCFLLPLLSVSCHNPASGRAYNLVNCSGVELTVKDGDCSLDEDGVRQLQADLDRALGSSGSSSSGAPGSQGTNNPAIGRTTTGSDGPGRSVWLVIAAPILVVGIVAALLPRGPRQALAGVAAVAAAVMVFLGYTRTADAITARAEQQSRAAPAGNPFAGANPFQVSPGVGFYLVLAGLGLVVLVGGVDFMLSRPPRAGLAYGAAGASGPPAIGPPPPEAPPPEAPPAAAAPPEQLPPPGPPPQPDGPTQRL